MPVYSVTYKGKIILEDSPLGLETNIGDFSRNMSWKEQKTNQIDKIYTQDRIKKSKIHYQANELVCSFQNADKREIEIVFRVSNNDIAFRYVIPRKDGPGSCVVERETTGFDFPAKTTAFLTPQSDAMIGWMRTKPSYEEEYKADAPVSTPSQYGHGYTFPCLFCIGDDGWALISETGVDSRYCASHLSEAGEDGRFTIAFPLSEENNGNGTVAPGLALPAATPWRTITVGENLKPIVETTVIWDETIFIDGYPGKYCVLARRHGDKWYVAGVNAQKGPLKLKIHLPMFEKDDKLLLYNDDEKRNAYTREVYLNKNNEITLTIQSEGGILLVGNP